MAYCPCFRMTTPIPQTTNRIAAIDIARVAVIFCVMYAHLPLYRLPGGLEHDILRNTVLLFFGNISYIYLIMAGYFASRDATWRKALRSAGWCLASFILWNGIYILLLELTEPGTDDHNQWGLCSLFFEQCRITNSETCSGSPANFPLWFLRDLILLFLFTPVISRFAKILLPALIICALIPDILPYFLPNCEITASTVSILSPTVVTMYTVGCVLRQMSKEKQKRLLSYHNIWLILAYFIFQGAMFAQFGFLKAYPSCVFHNLLACWIAYQMCRLLELHFPRIKKYAFALSPATFLVFVSHLIFFRVVPTPDFLTRLLLPFLTFACCFGLLLVLIRCGGPISYLVAHYKRPADTPQPPKAASPDSR